MRARQKDKKRRHKGRIRDNTKKETKLPTTQARHATHQEPSKRQINRTRKKNKPLNQSSKTTCGSEGEGNRQPEILAPAVNVTITGMRRSSNNEDVHDVEPRQRWTNIAASHAGGNPQTFRIPHGLCTRQKAWEGSTYSRLVSRARCEEARTWAAALCPPACISGTHS